MKHTTIHYIAGFLFGLIALLHLIRLIYNIEAVFGGWNVPLWVSVLGLLVTGILSILLFKSAKN